MNKDRYLLLKENKQRIEKIQQLLDTKQFRKTIDLCTLHLQKYPEDVFARFERAKANRALKYYESSINDLKYIICNNAKPYIVLELFYLYYYLNRYEDALDLLPMLYNMKTLNNQSLAIMELIMKKQLNIPFKTMTGKRCEYLMSQIIDYTDERLFEHLNEHKKKAEIDESVSYFNNNVNLNYLIHIVKENLKINKKVDTNDVLEIHYFAISNIGEAQGNICNYIKVAVMPNTLDIVSIYPVAFSTFLDNNIELLKCDRNLLFEEKNKVKSLTQINKFYNRYKKELD